MNRRNLKVDLKCMAILPACLTAMLLAAGLAVQAQLVSTSTLRVSLVHSWIDPDVQPWVDPEIAPIATLEKTSTGGINLVVRMFNRSNGYIEQDNMFVSSFSTKAPQPVDVLISTVFAPGSVLVLDSARRVIEFPLALNDHGKLYLRHSPAISVPAGPDSVGAGTVLGESPNPAAPDLPFLGIGTVSGSVLVTFPWIDPDIAPVVLKIASTPIRDLGPLTQVGYFALAAVTHDAQGVGHVIGVNPDANRLQPGLQPATTFNLKDVRSTPLIDFGSQTLDRRSSPWIDPEVNPIVTANGTRDIAALQIPANPGFGGTMGIIWTDPETIPIRQVVFGSLTFLPVDGSTVLYNRRFTLEGGFDGRIWTLLGASMLFDPGTLSLRGKGQWVKAAIECDNNRSAEIDLSTLVMSVDGILGAVPAALHPAPWLEDVDGDTNVELIVRFDRGALAALAAKTTGGEQLVRCSWLYTDGSTGTSSTFVRMIR